MRSLLLALALALPLAGCLDSLAQRFNPDEPAVAPDPQTFTGQVSPGFRKNETFPVIERMSALEISMNLTVQGAPGPLPALAQLEVTLSPPEGAPEKRTLTPQAPRAGFQVSRPVTGDWTLSLVGNGLGGAGAGASYKIVVTQTAEA